MIEAFAFWKYDTFPYLLGGKVIKLLPEGYVVAQGYETMKFKYLFLCTIEEGEKIHEELTILQHNRSHELEQLNNKYIIAKCEVVEKFTNVVD